MSKILLLDIETLPGLAYVWSLWGENIPLERLIRPGRVVCWAAQWLGEKEVMFGAEWEDGGRDRMLDRIFHLLAQADAVITYNGDKFDLPKLLGEFATEGLGHPGPSASIDLYKTVKKLGLQSNKLAFAAPHLKIGEKIKTEGFSLWAGVDAGDYRAQNKMKKYNQQDTRLLGRLYKALRPFIKSHPYLGDKAGACPACGSSRVQRRGNRRTKSFLVERLHCQGCGAWSDGVRRKIP